MNWIMRALRREPGKGPRARRPGSDGTGAGDRLPKYTTFDCRDGKHDACPVCRCDCHRELLVPEEFLGEAAPEITPAPVKPPSPDVAPALRRA